MAKAGEKGGVADIGRKTAARENSWGTGSEKKVGKSTSTSQRRGRLFTVLPLRRKLGEDGEGHREGKRENRYCQSQYILKKNKKNKCIARKASHQDN